MSVATINESSLNEDGLNFVRVNIGDAQATVAFNMFDRDPTLRFTPITSSYQVQADLSKRILLTAPAVTVDFTPTGRVVAISNGYFPSSVMTASFDATADVYKRQQLFASSTTALTPTATLNRRLQLSGSSSTQFITTSNGMLFARVSGSIESTFDLTGRTFARHRLSGTTSIRLDPSASVVGFSRNHASGSTGIVFNQSADLSVCQRSQVQGSKINFEFTPTANVDYRGMRTGVIEFALELEPTGLGRLVFIGSQQLTMQLNASANLSTNIFSQDLLTMSRPFTDREMTA